MPDEELDPILGTGARRPVVLIVDEIPSVIRLLQLELAIQGFDVVAAEVGEDTYLQVEKWRPDLILLEVMLPGLSGFEVLSEVKARYPACPIVFLTAQDNPADQAFAFDLGADDYITKPFDPAELSLRLNSLLSRKTEAPRESVLQSGDVSIDLLRKSVRRGSQAIGLTTNEWALLYALALEPNNIHEAAHLLSAVWGEEYVRDVRYLEMWIDILRRKVEHDPAEPKLIIGNPQDGYTLRSD